MPGSVRDGLTRKHKRKERRNHEDLCKAVYAEQETGGERAGQRREETDGGQHKEQNKVI